MADMAKKLPIEDIKTDLFNALDNDALILLTAPPGAGKSTVLPLWLLDKSSLDNKKIYLLQPRRVAAKNIALYLANQLGESVGETVGYRLRNDVCVGKNTRLEVITEGILTRIMQADPEMADCSLVIFDEFHERSVQADLAFAIARDIQEGLRDDLTLLLMSATLASDQIKSTLPNAKLLTSQGRSFPITYQYLPPNNLRFWREHTLDVIKQQSINLASSILVFLPSSGDIKWLAEQLTPFLPSNIVLHTLFGDLALAEQQKAIFPSADGLHKIVLATNIAETSLTIEGVNLVIDAGLEKVAVFDEQTLSNQLQQQMTCKASAIQRAGRAGRLEAGHCIRLFGEDNFQRRPEQAISSIQQTDLVPVLIEAARWGVDALNKLPMLELPNQKKEQQAWQTLNQLMIVDDKFKLTSHGERVAKLSCHPRFAHMIIKSQEIALLGGYFDSLTRLACLITALLEERDIFVAEQARDNADIALRISVLIDGVQNKKRQSGKHFRIIQQAQQLLKQINHRGKISFSESLPAEHCGLLLALAFPERIAKARNNQGDYLAANGKGMSLSIDDALAAQPYIVIANAGLYRKKLSVRLAAAVNFDELMDLNLVKIDTESVLEYQVKNDRITAEKQTKCGAIIIAKKVDNAQLSSNKIPLLWCQQVSKNGLSWLNWKEDDKRLLTRLRWLNTFQAHLALPDYSEQALLDDLAQWFAPFVSGVTNKAKLSKLNLSEMLLSLVEYPMQQKINKIAPEYYQGPTGRKCPISYDENKSPKVALPMQEMYGVASSPFVGDIKGEKIPVTLAFMSPAGRPIQITQDLAGFWQGSYREVQKDMKANYPRHTWLSPEEAASGNFRVIDRKKKICIISDQGKNAKIDDIKKVTARNERKNNLKK